MAKLMGDYNVVKNGKVSHKVGGRYISNYHRKEKAWTT